jgi:hypothetical protein
MNHSNPPFPDDPMSGYLEFDSLNDIRPNDQLRVTTDSKKFYEILSIRETSHTEKQVILYEHTADSIVNYTKSEVKSILKKDDSYLWSILNRGIFQVESGQSVVVYVSAAEETGVKDHRILYFGWQVLPQFPPTMTGEFNSIHPFSTFSQMKDSIETGSDLFTEFPAQKSTIDWESNLCKLVSSAEYNADQMFGLKTETTYSDGEQNRIKEAASKIKHTALAFNSIYN